MSEVVDKKRYELQLEAVAAIEQAGYNAVCIMPTGSGKALTLIECLKRLDPKGVIYYLCESTNNRDKTFKDELIKWGAEKYIDRITFMCYQTSYKLEDQEVELCLADELDYIGENYALVFKNNKFKHIIGVTATLSAEKRKLIETIAPIVFEKGLQEIEDQGLLNKSRYFEVNYMLTPKENKKYLEYNQQFVRLLQDSKKNTQELEFLKIRRGQFLAGLESSAKVCKRLVDELLKDESSRIIIFAGLAEQADKVCEHSYHSKSVNNWLTEFHEGRIRALSVVNKVSRGVNIGTISPDAQKAPVNRLIFESIGRSETKFLQRQGRGKRLDSMSVLDVYILIANYKNYRGQTKPTVMARWVLNASKSIDYNPIQYKFNKDN